MITAIIALAPILILVLNMCSQKWNNFAHFYLLGGYYVLQDKITSRRCRNLVLGDHTGEVAVVTGGHRGIGAMVTRDLLSAGIHVILGCRNIEDGVKFVASLREQGITTGSAIFLPLDLSSLESVKKFAEDVLQSTDKINFLINNAGIINFQTYKETEDKIESQWQVNFLSHFLLCHMLLPTLQSTNGRVAIVNVSSIEHKVVLAMDYDNLNKKEHFDGMTAYGRSKLAQVMFTFYLNDRLKSINSNVEVVAAHPGIVDTDIFNTTLLKRCFPFLPRLFFKSAKVGAKPIVYAALYGKGGEYIGNCAPESPSTLSQNQAEQQKLFDISKTRLNISLYGNLF